MTDAQAGAARDRAALAITDLVRRLIVAATDGRAHLSHEGGSTCLGCLTVKQAKLFVRGMNTDDAAERTPATEAAP